MASRSSRNWPISQSELIDGPHLDRCCALEGGAKVLGLTSLGSPIRRLDDLDHVAGVLGSDDGRLALVDPVNQLHDVLVNVFLANASVGFGDVGEDELPT